MRHHGFVEHDDDASEAIIENAERGHGALCLAKDQPLIRQQALISRGTGLSVASDSIPLLSQILTHYLTHNFGFPDICASLGVECDVSAFIPRVAVLAYDAAHGSAYHAFLAMGAYQDLGTMPPAPDRIAASLAALQSADGAFANDPGRPHGSTPATAAAVTLIRHLDMPASPALADWLLARCHDGGFFASPDAPVPDLLSTATALHALSSLHASIDGIREGCLDFVDSLWTSQGAFYGTWADDVPDCEYTFYGLLALGHLAV